MSLSRKLIFLLLLSSLSSKSHAMGAEEERLRGFAEHQSNNKQFDKARAQGERGFLEEVEQWENQRHRDLQGYKTQKKASEMTEDGPEAQTDTADKKKYSESYEKNRRQYVEEKLKAEQFSREGKNVPTESQELGLDVERPRYEYRKRAAFGAKPRYGSAAGGSSSFGGSGFTPGGSSFPPPPTFDDFGGSSGGGYVPAPNLPEDFGDVPPPPPPPPPTPAFGDESLGGGFTPDYNPIPPPPPPPPFGEEGVGEF